MQFTQPLMLCTQATDMRKSFTGLIAMVKTHLKDNPCNGQVFVFINKNRSLMKCLYFESGGYCIWSKRLEQGRFAVLGKNSSATKIALTTTEFAALIEGFDIAIVLKYIQPVIKHKDTQVITTKSAPVPVFEKSMADVSFITGLIIDKFLYHLPLYRQHQKLQLSGITISRNTLTNYVRRAALLLKPIHEAILRSILQSKVLAMDNKCVRNGFEQHKLAPQG